MVNATIRHLAGLMMLLQTGLLETAVHTHLLPRFVNNYPFGHRMKGPLFQNFGNFPGIEFVYRNMILDDRGGVSGGFSWGRQ